MAEYASQVERLGDAPWRSADTLRPWQEGTAVEMTD
jgi:hypothetical protein